MTRPNEKKPATPFDFATMEEIAEKHCGVKRLAEQGSDSLDFHDIHVTSLRSALEAAYRAGRAEGAAAPRPKRPAPSPCYRPAPPAPCEYSTDESGFTNLDDVARVPMADRDDDAVPPLLRPALAAREVNTAQFEFAHGRAPRGRGHWVFCLTVQGDKRSFMPGPNLLYGEAKRQALAEAKRLGANKITVEA